MQKSILILFLLFPSFLFSQNLPINYETKKVEYTSVIDANGSKSELFSRAKNWTSSTFNSSQDLIQTKDEDYLAIKGLAFIDYTIPVQNTPTVVEVPMHFTLELDFSDNKYRYKITDIYFEDTKDLGSAIIPIEQTVLSRNEQEEIVAKRFNSSNAKFSENEYQEALNLAFNQYDQFKSKGHWTIMGILQLLTNGMTEGRSSIMQESSNNYESKDLVIRKLSDNVYVHTSYLNTEDFGKVICNGMIVLDENEAIIFDTPTDDKASQELIDWITHSLNRKTVGIVATHFHVDCLGGLNEFHKNNIPSYANNSTIEFAKNNKSAIPQNGFTDSFVLMVGNKEVYLEYFGEGHTKDNIIGYFPSEEIMFGGCLIKEVGADKGNLDDANPDDWSNTVRKIKNKYQQAKTIIPGHGKLGGQELLDYTIELFENK